MRNGESVRRRIAAGADHLLTLAYPRRCPVCCRILIPEEGLICRECFVALPWISQPSCLKCGCPLEDDAAAFCPDCARRNHSFVSGKCVFRYEGELRSSVMRMKFHNRRENIDFYAAAMAASGRDFLARVSPGMILPIPMHPRKRRERGFDQCLLLARRFSEYSGIPLEEKNLRRIRYTRAQKGLDAGARGDNVRDAFLLTHPERIREPVLLVDDIATTLATIDSACRELNRRGFYDVWFMALCTGRNG